MTELDLTEFDGIDSGSSAASLLRVLLSNLGTGLRRQHLRATSVRELLNAAAAWGRAYTERGRHPHVDQLYLQCVRALEAAAPNLFFEREQPVTSFADRVAVSYQPSWAFRFWLDDSVLTAKKNEHTYADTVLLSRAFEKRGLRRPSATIGQASTPLWLTPSMGVVEAVLEAAKQQAAGERVGILDDGGADRLRRLLGLERRTFPEQAVMVVTRRRIRDFATREQGVARNFAAPTQFDAQGYPRFRHWPVRDGQPVSDLGRTWALDADGGGAIELGAPEAVALPLPLAEVSRIVPLGGITDLPLSPDERRAADARFADLVSEGRSLQDLLAAVEDQLALTP